ncbi:MAG: transcriptional repressor [Proteobacteria bacterium]|nr:transcriptional repressor [Pseudomonadota bacterium]
MSLVCDHHKHKARPAASLGQAMSMAEGRCLEAGERWTAPRKRVFELLLQAGAPVKAYDLIADYGHGQDRGVAKPPTIYRALDFLSGMGLVHRIPSLNAYVACAVDEAVHSASFLICDCCGSAEEFDPKVEPVVRAQAEHLGFRPTAMALEVRGLCRACA